MNLVLMTREEADQQSLMHYRTKGSRNGVRRYQDANGNLTPEGRQHYAEMYGWGDAGGPSAPVAGNGNYVNRQRLGNAQMVRSNGGQMPRGGGRAQGNVRPAAGVTGVRYVQNQQAQNGRSIANPQAVRTNGQPQAGARIIRNQQAQTAQTPNAKPTAKAKVLRIEKKPTQNAQAPNAKPTASAKILSVEREKTGSKNEAVSDNKQKLSSSTTRINKNGELTDANGKTIGQPTKDGKYYGKGNIDLNSRAVVKNDDGSISTERSFSVNIDGKETLIPTVVDGKILDEDAAIDHFYETGEHLGQFDTVEEAEEYAEALHNRQDWYYNKRDGMKHSDDDNYLMHYRTKGSKNGERRFQREDGSLTPEGYQHYKEMYGWGDKKEATISKDEYKSIKREGKTEQRDYKLEKENAPKANKIGTKAYYKSLDAGFDKSRATLERNAGHTLRANYFHRKALKEEAEAKKLETKAKLREQKYELAGIDEKGNEVVPTVNVKDKKNVATVRKAQLREMQENIKNARNMSDEDLNKALNRLRMEKQYAELLNERANREKGPIVAMASKLFQDAAMDLAKKSLTKVVDKMVSKIGAEKEFKLEDYKDADLMKLDSDKLQKVANAFNNAANIARNKLVIENGGRDPNQNNGNKQGNNNNQSKGDTQPQNNPDNGGSVSKNQRKKMRSMANSGKSAAEIAKELGVSESTVRQYAGEQLKDNKSNDSSASGSSSGNTSESPSNDSNGKQKKEKSSFNAMSAIWKNHKDLNRFMKDQAKQKAEMDEAERKKRLDDYSKWINGAEWEKKKVEIQAEYDAEQKRRKDQKTRNQARLFGYSW